MKKIKRISSFLLVLLIATVCTATICYAEKDDLLEKYDGKRIGIQTGTIYAEIAEDTFPNSKIYYFSSIPDATAAITANKIDAIYADLPVLRYCASQVEGVECAACGESNDYMAILSSKDEKGKAYIAQFNEYLKKIEKSGELDRLTTKWFDGKEEERTMENFSSLPKTDKNLIIATEPTFPPFEYIKNEQIIGFEPEIIYGFCKEYGYTAQFENVSFSGIITGVTTGKFDLGVSGFSITDERKKQVEFSDVVFTSGAGIAFRSDGESIGFFNNVSERFKSTFITENRWKMFANGLLTTLQISLISIISGTLLGFFVYIFYRKGNPLAKIITNFVKWLIHGLPVVVFLMILFYIVFGNSKLSGIWVAIIGFTLIFACSVIGMLQIGESAVDIGQYTAAKALGYSNTKTFFKIILPQAAQCFLPSFSAEVTSHIKSTSIVGYIAVVDITKVGDLVRGRTYDTFFPLIAISIAYFVIEWILSTVIGVIIRKCNPKNRNIKRAFKGVTL